MSAKGLSLLGIVVAVAISLSFNVFYVIYNKKVPSLDEQQSVLLLAGSMVVFFSPVYLSIWLDKIFGKKG